MDPIVTAALVDSGTKILGGLFGGKEKSVDPQQQLYWQRVAQQKSIKDYWDITMSKAGEYGIHPLTALGVNPSSGGSTFTFGGGSSSNNRAAEVIQEAGGGISRAIAAHATIEERQMAKASAALQLQNQELQNARLASEIRLMNQPGLPPGMSDATRAGGDPRYPGQADMPFGYGDSGPMSRKAGTPYGFDVDVLNEDVVGDSELLQMLHGAGVTIPQLVTGMHKKLMQNRMRELDVRIAKNQFKKARSLWGKDSNAANIRYLKSKPRWSRYGKGFWKGG